MGECGFASSAFGEASQVMSRTEQVENCVLLSTSKSNASVHMFIIIWVHFGPHFVSFCFNLMLNFTTNNSSPLAGARKLILFQPANTKENDNSGIEF